MTVLAAGTIFRFSTNILIPSYSAVPGVLDFGAIGNVAEAKENTTLSDVEKTFGVGMVETPDQTVKGQFLSLTVDDPDGFQDDFLDACKARVPMLVQIEYPDKLTPSTGTGTIAGFGYQPMGMQLDPVKGEDWMMFTCPGKQSNVSWTKPT